MGAFIEQCEFKAAIEGLFEFIRNTNKYFDEQKPWVTAKEDPKRCGDTIYTCIHVIANLAVLLNPFLPFSSAKILQWLNCEHTWGYKEVKTGDIIGSPTILFERIDKKVIDEEVERLKTNSKARKHQTP